MGGKLLFTVVPEVEVLRTGHSPGDIGMGDLQDVARAFPEAGIEVPVRLDTTEAVRWFGQEDGAPALGWVKALRLERGRLFASLMDVPVRIARLIREGRIGGITGTLSRGFKDASGRTWPAVLKAVSLSGVPLPRVRTLEDVRVALMSEGAPSRGLSIDELTVRRVALTGEPYEIAVRAVLRDNEDLAREYLGMREGGR